MDKKDYMWTGKCPIYEGTGHKRGEVLSLTDAEAREYLAREAVVPITVGKRAEALVVDSKGKLTWEAALEKVKEEDKPSEKKPEKKDEGVKKDGR